jgi:hypothetical protein
MATESVPRTAAWLLKVLCSSPEYEAVLGDLDEEYQRGRSRFWYWRQALAIILLGRYHQTVRQPFRSNRGSLTRAGAVALFVSALCAVLFSEIAPLLALAIPCAFVIAGIMQLLYDGTATTSPETTVARIDSSKIPVGGGLGAGILIVILLTGVLLDLPTLRLMAIPGLLGGLVFGYARWSWRQDHPPTPRVTPLRLR